MALLVYVTEPCREDAGRHGQSSMIESIKSSIERWQNLTGFELFLPTPFAKRKIGRNFRLLAYTVPFGDDELILFLRFVGRGSKDYEHFLSNWSDENSPVIRQLQPYDQIQLRSFYEELTRVTPLPRPGEPSSEERAWLYDVFRKPLPEDELLVLETESWARRMRSSENRDFLALYHQVLEQLGTRNLQEASLNTDIAENWDPNRRVGILYHYRPEVQRLLLLEPIRQADDFDATKAEYRRRLASIGTEQHQLSQIAARSYPYIMILDQDAWLRIQKDEEANLALSPEEAELLDSVHRAGVEGALGYPLFINGRAGSGKSTMLQYLAADYLDFAIRTEATTLPVYLTSSADLLDGARRTVKGLLMTHHERLLENPLDEAEVDRLLGNSFAVFHDFLYRMLSVDDRAALPRDKYVSYAEFRRLWANDFAKYPEAKNLAPDLAWHTLRSYIKGIRSDAGDDLDPEEFKALPRRRRSVSEETYRKIYKSVWLSWYQPLCAKKQYWDDQDLAARVLEQNLPRKMDCVAVFCDEAQDFTPVELDIIFQLSLFGRRSLQPEELKRVPIVFAGDPLQTINPTGFRWDAVQAEFHERFCATLDPRRRGRVQLSCKELRFNYRSNPGIVKFCNLIQLLRAALLDAAEIGPQEPWWIDAPAQTVWFVPDTEATKQQLEKRPDIVKIVNCEYGEEADFVKSDPILQNLKEEAGVFRNILGPTRAKGLEFPSVVVYRYGGAAPEDFSRVLTGEVALRDSEERLPYEYFLNRLYVAASRAKGHLVIVDSAHARERFWHFASDMEAIERLMERAGGAAKWRDAVSFLVQGNEETWEGERIDSREQALEYSVQGTRNRDPYLLRQAALAYGSSGDHVEAGKCLALAAEFEGRRKEAGDKYRDLGLFEDAFRCYWEGGSWVALRQLARQEASLTYRLESYAADFMASSGVPHPNLLDSFIRAASDPSWRDAASRDATWQEVVARLAERLLRNVNDKSIPWAKFHTVMQGLVGAGMSCDNSRLALMAYAAGSYGDAVHLWERAGVTDREEYRRSKAHVEKFPFNLRWFDSLKEYATVLQQWRDHAADLPDPARVGSWVRTVVIDAALDQGDIRLAMEMLGKAPDYDGLRRLIDVALGRGDMSDLAVVACFAARMLVRTGDYESAVRAAESLRFPGLSASHVRQIHAAVGNSGGLSDVLRAVVEEFAGSDDLATAPAERQGPVAELLSRHFIGKSGGSSPFLAIRAELVGAAIERAGKIIDALQFYEDLSRHASPEAQKFATERLIRNLERHAEYFRVRGDDRQWRQRQSRAQQLRQRSGLGDRKLSDYPILRSAPDAGGGTEWTRGPFNIVLSKAHERLRIAYADRFETVTLNWKAGTLLGDANVAKLEPAPTEVAAWSIGGWDATIRLSKSGGSTRIVASFSGDPFEIVL
jgi:hypothetical protein